MNPIILTKKLKACRKQKKGWPQCHSETKTVAALKKWCFKELPTNSSWVLSTANRKNCQQTGTENQLLCYNAIMAHHENYKLEQCTFNCLTQPSAKLQITLQKLFVEWSNPFILYQDPQDNLRNEKPYFDHISERSLFSLVDFHDRS